MIFNIYRTVFLKVMIIINIFASTGHEFAGTMSNEAQFFSGETYFNFTNNLDIWSNNLFFLLKTGHSSMTVQVLILESWIKCWQIGGHTFIQTGTRFQYYLVPNITHKEPKQTDLMAFTNTHYSQKIFSCLSRLTTWKTRKIYKLPQSAQRSNYINHLVFLLI